MPPVFVLIQTLLRAHKIFYLLLQNSLYKNFEEVLENVKKIKKDWKSISEEEQEQIIRFDSCLNFDVDDKLSGHLDGVIPEKDNMYGAVEMYVN